MYCRSRPQYRSDLGWILGVAFLGTLTRCDAPTCVQLPSACGCFQLAPQRTCTSNPGSMPGTPRVLAALASPPATKALDPDPFPCRSLRHAVYAALLHFGLETAMEFQVLLCTSLEPGPRRPPTAVTTRSGHDTKVCILRAKLG